MWLVLHTRAVDGTLSSSADQVPGHGFAALP